MQYSDHDVETPHGIMLMGDTIKQFIVQHNHFDNAARVYHVESNATARPTVKDTLIVVRLLAVSWTALEPPPSARRVLTPAFVFES